MRKLVHYAVVLIILAPWLCGFALDQKAKSRDKRALQWSVASSRGVPLDGAFVIEVVTPIEYSVKWLPTIEQVLGLKRDSEALRAAVESEVLLEEAFFDLFQYQNNGYVFPFRLDLSGITDEGQLSHSWDWQERAGRARRDGYEVLGSLFIVAKTGYQSQVVFVSDESLQLADVLESVVIVELMPLEEPIPDSRQEYLDQNLAVQRDMVRYWEEVRPGVFSSFVTPPFSVWRSELEAIREEASRQGNAADEAWMMLAISGCSRFTGGGYDRSGGESDLGQCPVAC